MGPDTEPLPSRTPPARPPRRRGVPCGRIGGIPIVIAPSWFLGAALIVALATPVVGRIVPGLGRGTSVAVAVALAVLLGISVLAHELGHCVAARSMGLGVREVRLYLVGGASELERLPATPKEEALVAAAGPAVSALLALICGLLVGSTSTRGVTWLILIEMAAANAIVAVFNILPALPLDGGRVLRAGVWAVFHRERAGAVAGAIGGLAVTAALIVWAIYFLQSGSRSSLLQAAIVAVMAVFVGAGAIAEFPRPSRRRPDPPGVRVPGALTAADEPRVGDIMVPAAHIPAETPLASALAIPGPVDLVGVDGRSAGLLDPERGAHVVAANPAAPASAAIGLPRPEIIVAADDGAAEAVLRCGRLGSAFLVVRAADGTFEGIVMRTELDRAVAAMVAQANHR